MEIIPVSHVDEVLSHALVNPLVPIEWEEGVDDVVVKSKDDEESDVGGVTTH